MEQLFWQFYENVYDSILLQLHPYRLLLSEAITNLDPQPGGSYLDAGCGTGNFLKLMLEKEFEVKLVGADFSQAMLGRTKSKLSGYGKNIILEKQDFNEKLSLKEASLDGINCLNVLYAVKNYDLFMSGLNKLLKPGGKLVLSTPVKKPRIVPIMHEHIAFLKIHYGRIWKLHFAWQLLKLFFPLLLFIMINIFIKSKRDFKFFSDRELIGLLVNSGFEVVSIKKMYGGQNWFVLAQKAAHYV